MIKILYIIFLSLIVTNCTFQPVVNHHGVPFLEKKQLSLEVNVSNKNDIKKILGKPSTKSKFDNDVWIYIERKQTQSNIKNLGKMKIFYIILAFFIISSCSFNQVVKHHGVHFFEEKKKYLKVNESNKNDITKLLGIPSTTSKFDNDLWIYIERKQTQSKLRNLGKMKIFKNDVLVLEINEYGILKKKNFYNKDDLENIKFTKKTTESEFKRNSFIYEFMSSMRQKINDPLGQRAKKSKEISQR